MHVRLGQRGAVPTGARARAYGRPAGAVRWPPGDQLAELVRARRGPAVP